MDLDSSLGDGDDAAPTKPEAGALSLGNLDLDALPGDDDPDAQP